MTPSTADDSSLAIELPLPSHNGPTRSWSRSPHLYHRRSSSLKDARPEIKQVPDRYSESSDSTESEERGTEADDEKGPILKGLPAPPLRGRKGLKGSKTPVDQTPAISPFPTPPALSDKRPSYFAEDKIIRSSKLSNKDTRESFEAYKKYVKRRHAEIARRGTEACLLALIGLVASRSIFHADTPQLLSDALIASATTLVCLCSLFPFRVAFHRFQSGKSLFVALKTGFHIPSRFDPGPLLYPVLIPFFVSTSLSPVRSDMVFTNLILGISSLPRQVLPFNTSPSVGYLHWLFALSPLFGSLYYLRLTPLSSSRYDAVDGEILALLFPLHQSVLGTLKYLTSTSLDPAEIQLLSTGLINLYLFASSPQTQILKSLLWVGALCLFIFCQKPLSWEVRLARIPSWKFARNKSPSSGLLAVSENVLNLILPQHRYNFGETLGSDDEDYEYLKSARRMTRNSVRLRKTKIAGTQSDLEPIMSEKERSTKEAAANGLKRSLTLTVNGTHPPTTLRRRKTLQPLPSTGLLSLTYTQAQACKWLISGYVFGVTGSVILVVVRYYVSIQALSSYDPFGWAIGYLFGNIQPLRLWVVSNNLESWIKLPIHHIHHIQGDFDINFGWIEDMRQIHIGSANTRLLIAAYCIAILIVGIGLVLQLGTIVEVDTRRKVFHGMMVGMLLPTVFIDPCFIALALSLILAIFLLLDLFRASQLPPISKPLTTFLAPYVDGRDYRGPVIVSPIFLLIGCAIPLWLSLAGSSREGRDPWQGWDTNTRDLSMISGIVCVGMGDAAASLVGRRYGRTKWFWGGGKSLEGSFAFAVAVTVGLGASYAWLSVGGWHEWDFQALPVALFKMALAGSGASILESVLTAGNDNVIVPIGLWLLTRGLCI